MQAISRTKIKSNLRKKTNPELAETISLALKHKPWNKLAKTLASSSNKHKSLNLSQIDKEAKAGDTILITGKVLSEGNLTKKVVICALSISEHAREKLKDSKSEFVKIKDEIEKNKKFEGVKLI